jgi:hypothetical protein
MLDGLGWGRPWEGPFFFSIIMAGIRNRVDLFEGYLVEVSLVY